jgi:hypothetical protein
MRRLAIFLLVFGACKPSAPEAGHMLASPEPAKRAEGARALQELYAKDPAKVGDHGEAYWAARLARAKGRPLQGALNLLDQPASSGGGEAGGGGATMGYRLDHYWLTTLHVSTRGDATVFGYDPPRRLVEHVEVAPPAAFTGAWTTYFVNGAAYEVLDLEGGVRRRSRVFHDNGRPRYEEHYVDGKIDGTVLSAGADGAPEWEKSYALGKQVGVDRMYHPGGKLFQEAHYVDDKLDGVLRDYSESGKVTFCAVYRAGTQLDGGCPE